MSVILCYAILDPTKEDVQGSSSLAAGTVIVILIAGVVFGIAVTCIYYRCRCKKTCKPDPSQEGLARESGGGDDDDDDDDDNVGDDNDGNDDDDNDVKIDMSIPTAPAWSVNYPAPPRNL